MEWQWGMREMSWGACGHRASPSSKMHKETSTLKGDSSLGFAVTLPLGPGVDSAGPWLDRGHYLGFIILCVFSNCKMSQIKCIEFRNIEITESGCHSDPSDPHGIDVCPAPAVAMPPGTQVQFLPPTSPTPSPAPQKTVPLPFGVQLPWQALETPS